MGSVTSRQEATRWLLENGPEEFELLFRAIIFRSSTPILIADDERNNRQVSFGASRFLGMPRDEIIGRRLDDFTESSFKPLISERWRAFMARGEQHGVLRLVNQAGGIREVEYIAKGNVLPVRHLLALGATTHTRSGAPYEDFYSKPIPPWAQDFGLFLLDTNGQIVTWYSGAERIYGYRGDQVIGQHVSLLFTDDDTRRKEQRGLRAAATEGHVGSEDLHLRSDGSPFWANVITMALRNDNADLQGFAKVVRDFTKRHQRDEELRVRRTRARPLPMERTEACLVYGEFDQILETNQAFRELVGFGQEELPVEARRLSALTPPEYFDLVELAHDEELHCGACSPFEKELIRKDGSRVQVLVATTVLSFSPFRWIALIRELRKPDRLERIENESAESKSDEIVGSSTSMKRLRSQIAALAATDATALILGEAGTGKHLVARTVHKMSARRNSPFINLNCADIPTRHLAGELFGYEKGAFAGALSQKIGAFELARSGTVLLDGAGEIPLDLEPKLLRSLQGKAFERLGGSHTIPFDVRLLATTERSLKQLTGDRLFRPDFYHHLKVFPIAVPPLRDHPEDIPELAWHFVKKCVTGTNRPIDKIPAETMRGLLNCLWPGNVLELKNFIERSVSLSRGPSLNAPMAELREKGNEAPSACTLAEVEREYILRVFRETDGVISVTAARLGMPRTTLNAMMKKLKISRSDL